MQAKNPTVFKEITTEENEAEFQIRFDGSGQAGMLYSRSGKAYFVVDSADYWYDMIQTSIPPAKKCACKNAWFTVKFEYVKREEYDDFREVIIHLTCTECGKAKRIPVQIDYGPTDALYDKPITFCEKPVIKYKLQSATGYWDNAGLEKYLEYMCNMLGLKAMCWYWRAGKRYAEYVDTERLLAIAQKDKKDWYISILFMQKEVALGELIKETDGADKKGCCLKRDIWRNREMIELSSPLNMIGYGKLYYINLCTQFIDKGNVADKSDEFKALVKTMFKWLGENYKKAGNGYNTEKQEKVALPGNAGLT